MSLENFINIKFDDHTYIYGPAYKIKHDTFYSLMIPNDEIQNKYYLTKIIDDYSTYIVYIRQLKLLYLWCIKQLNHLYNIEFDINKYIIKYIYNYPDLYLYNLTLTKIVFTSTMRSDDYIKYFIKSNKVVKIIITNKGHQCIIKLENSIIINKKYITAIFNTDEYKLNDTILINDIVFIDELVL